MTLRSESHGLLLAAMLSLVLASAAPARAATPPGTAKPARPRAVRLPHADSLYARGAGAVMTAYLDSLRRVARTQGDDDLDMTASVRWAAARSFYFGALEEGRIETEQWLPRVREARDSTLLCIALRTVGYTQLVQQHYPEARIAYDEMLGVAKRARLRSMEGYALLGSSFLALQANEIVRSERGYRRALTLLSDPIALRTARAGLANSLMMQSRIAESRTEYERVLAEARAAGDIRNVAAAVNDLGAMEFSYGDPSLALPLFRESASLHHRAGRRGDELVALGNAVSCLTSIGRDADAMSLADTIVTEAIATRAGDVLGSTRVTVAGCRRRAGDLAGAERIARQVIAMGDSTDANQRLYAHAELARVQRATGRAAEAVTMLEATLGSGTRTTPSGRALLLGSLGEALLDAGRPGAAIAPLREARSLQYGFRGVEGVDIILTETVLARAFRATGRRDSALAHFRIAAERWEHGRADPRDPQWRAGFGGVAASMYGAYAATLIDPAGGGRPGDRAGAAFATLQPFRARTLEDALRGGASRARTARVSLEVFRRSTLAPGEIFLDLYMAADTSILIAITRDSLRAVGLPAQGRFVPRLRRFRDGIASGSSEPAVMEAAAVGLGRDLFGGVTDLVRDANVVLLSSGAAAQYPLGMVRLPGESEPLASRRVFSLVPSATLLAASRASAARAPQSGLLALSRDTDAEGRRLDGVARETRWLSSAFPAAEIRQNDGRRPLDDMLARIGSREVLHLAAHTRGSPAAPWRAGFLLGQGNLEDAYLTAARIADLEHPARICVLAGCASAGIAAGNEEIPSLASAWLASGAHAVIASLWPVADQSTADLVEEFYRGLSRGETAGAALVAAQRALQSRRGTSPRDWAGFVLVGDPATRTRLRVRG